MGDNGQIATSGKLDQGRGDTGAKIGKGFATFRGMAGKIFAWQYAEVGQIGIGAPLPFAKVLFPKACFLGRIGKFGPKCRGGLPAPQRRTGDQPRRTSQRAAQGFDPYRIAAIGRHIGAPAQPAIRKCRRMADQHQLCRAPALHRRIPSSLVCLFLLCHRTMSKTILITGGARSGKSVIAETKALSLGPRAVYIATAEVRDGEMAARIATHQARRGAEWLTHAEAFDLVGALVATDGQGPRLVDCLTLWLTNLMLDGRDWRAEGRALVAALATQTDPVVLVTNEVGGGIVPDNLLARDFRDAAGLLNQWVAAVADEVILAVAGLPLKVK